MKQSHCILGLESSCDDTSVALVRNHELIDCIVVSSSDLQSKFGGVVPELAARKHEEQFIPLVKELFRRSGISWKEITHVAYTNNPGLAGCLLVGKVFAKSLAFIHNKQIIPVNHIYGHIFSIFLTEQVKFPFLSLIVSGKTTALYYVKGFRDIELLDETKDNALGEVYDKVARELGLKYPGGPEIDKLFNRDRPVPRLLSNNPNPAQKFSYSGILSAVCRVCKSIRAMNIENKNEYIATMFQKWVIDGLIVKIKYWTVIKNVHTVTIGGGVAANKYLQEEIKRMNLDSFIVDTRFSGDNAAMIALYASYLI